MSFHDNLQWWLLCLKVKRSLRDNTNFEQLNSSFRNKFSANSKLSSDEKSKITAFQDKTSPNSARNSIRNVNGKPKEIEAEQKESLSLDEEFVSFTIPY